MDARLQGDTALVTAGGSGLGKATAMEFAREACNVVINDIDQRSLDETKAEIVSEIEEEGAIHTVQGDLTKADDIEELVEETVERYGTIDHLVTSSGGPPSGPFLEMEDEDWYTAFDLLVMSLVRLAREAYPYLKERNGGTIVTSTSRSVKEAIEGLVLSNSVRSGVAGLAKTFSMEFAPKVRTNMVMPGPTETQRQVDLIEAAIERGEYGTYEEGLAAKAEGIPLGRIGDPEEFAKFVVLLSSPLASYVNGAAIPIDGGAMASNV